MSRGKGKRLLALLLSIALLAGAGGGFVSSSVYAAEATQQTIQTNESETEESSEEAESVQEEALGDEAEQVQDETQEAAELSESDKNSSVDDSEVEGSEEEEITVSENDTRTIQSDSQGNIPGGGYVIPGYTRVSETTKLDTTKYYIIVAQDSQDRVYALYGNSKGFRSTATPPVSITDKGMVTAELNTSGSLTATWLNNSQPIQMEALHFTISELKSGVYSFRSSEGHYLDIGSQMLGDDAVGLTLAQNGAGYLIQRGESYLYFHANQDALAAEEYKAYQTDFWTPNKSLTGFTIYLYTLDSGIVSVDFSELQDLIDEADIRYGDTNSAGYTLSTWTEYEEALAAAKSAVTAQEGTQEEVEALEKRLREAMNALTLAPTYSGAKKFEYRLNSGNITAGEKYVLYIPVGAGKGRTLGKYGEGTSTILVSGVQLSNDLQSITLDTSSVSVESQVWEAVPHDGKIALKSTYGSVTRYLDLDTYSAYNIQTSSKPVGLTFTGDGNYVIKGSQYALAVKDGNTYTSDIVSASNINIFKQTEIVGDGPETADSTPPRGTTTNQPFGISPGQVAGSRNFGSPSLVAFGEGKLAAAATAQWDNTKNYGGTDIVVSVSQDNGKNWTYTTPLYFNDSTNSYGALAAGFSDPMLTSDENGKLYLLANLFPGGVGKVTNSSDNQPWSPGAANGYVKINGIPRLVLYYTPIPNQQKDNNYNYYIGDFSDDGYAPVYEYLGKNTYADAPSYYVNRRYDLYLAEVDGRKTPMYCNQLSTDGTMKKVQENVFYYNSYLHVRCAGYLVLTTSSNNGADWSEFTILNPTGGESNIEALYGAAGGQGIWMKESGLLVFPCYSWGNTMGGEQYASFIYSDDRGATWKRSPRATATAGSGESSIVQLGDTTLRMFISTDNSYLEYVDYTLGRSGQWTVSGVKKIEGVLIAKNLQHSSVVYEYAGNTLIMISAPRSQSERIDGKVYTFEVGKDAARTMILKDEYDVDPDKTTDYFSYASLTGLGASTAGVGLLYESQESPSRQITYDQIRIEDILGNSDFKTELSGIISKVYDGQKINADDFGLRLTKTVEERKGNASWLFYSDAACRNELKEAPKVAGTYWIRARLEADDTYKVNKSTPLSVTIEKRELTIERVEVSEDNSIVNGVTQVFFTGLAGEGSAQEQLILDQDYTAVFAYNHEDMKIADELAVKVTLKQESETAANYRLKSNSYTFKAQGHADIWLTSIESQKYTGSKTTQTFTLADGSTRLKEGVDYTVSYKNNINASEWELPDSNKLVMSSEGTDVRLMSIEGTLDPSAITDPSFNAKKAPQMIIKMKGNYKGTYTIYYQIEKVSFQDNADIVADDIAVTYTGKKQTPVPVVTWKGRKLVNNKDFYVKEYGEQKADITAFVGKAEGQTQMDLTLVGKGNFEGSRKIKLTIGKKDASVEEISMSKVAIKGIKPLIWSETEAKTSGMLQTGIIVRYKKDVLMDKAVNPENGEYTIRYENNKAVGTATIILEGTGEDKDGDKLAYIGTRRITFKINGSNISKVQAVGLLKSYTYTGDEIRPTEELNASMDKLVKFTYQASKTLPKTVLEENTHYTVSYQKNVNKGIATLILTGNPENGYTGTKKLTFKIVPDTLEVGTGKSFSVSITDKDMKPGDRLPQMPYMRGGSKPEVTVINGAGDMLVQGTDYIVTYKNNTKVADATASRIPTVVVKGKGNYAGTVELPFEIVQKDLNIYTDRVYIVAKDKIESTKKNNWKQSFKVYDADGKLISTKDYDKNVQYELIKVPDTEVNLTKGVLTDPNIIVPAGSEIKITVNMIGGNYTGTVTGTYRILQTGYDISKATIQIYPQEYTGEAIEIKENSALKKAILKNGKIVNELYLETDGGKQKNIQVVGYERNINKGTAKVTFEGIGEFGGTKTVTFKINQRTIDNRLKAMYDRWNWVFN